ncbi:hypothetical protein D3Z36_02895 [Lachnospiraceae bacterium]|nr:hypothetical protein [Lachnospiraceae bacterium]
MGLFRKKRKPKYVEEILEYDGSRQPEETEAPVKKRKSPAMEYCDQILKASKALEETKREYRTVTDYLTDIQSIENLPKQEMEEIQEVANHIMVLNASRDAYLNKEKKISDSQYAQMEQLQDQIPDIIKRLKENEAYQTTVKRDMQYLEGEREEWRYYKEALEQETRILRKVLFGLAGLFIAVIILIFVFSYTMHFDVRTPFLMAVIAAGAVEGLLVLRLQNDMADIKKSLANINRAIMLLNKISFKYVNVTNAVDYACEKYHVKNSYELNYVWEQYLEAAQEREKYERTNDDLEIFNNKLIRMLHGYHLYDSRIWIYQVHALLDKKEMVEVKHELVVRRQKLRSSMEAQIANIQKAKAEIQKLVKAHPGDDKEIQDILDALDKECGLTA